MNHERNLLAAAVADRVAFEIIDRNLTDEDFTEPGKVVIEHIKGYYERDPSAEHVVLETLGNQITATLSNPKHVASFEKIISGLGGADVSALNVVHEVLANKAATLGNRIAAKLAAGDTGRVSEMMDEYRALSSQTSLDEEESSELLNAPRLDELAAEESQGGLIRMFPKSLNERLNGGIRRGHHVIVFARPEMGKTMFVVNLMYGFLVQGLKVLYVCNEEPVEDTAIRVVTRLTDMSKYDVLNNPQEAHAAAEAKGYNGLFMQRLTPGTPTEIEALVRKVEPDVLIIDQLRNVSTGGKDDNITRNLEKAALAVRQIGGRNNCAVISVVQAGDSASGKAILEMNDVDSSNTGIPAQADLMIGIGASREDENASRRVLSLPKNKRSGNHDFFPVRVVPELSKILSME